MEHGSDAAHWDQKQSGIWKESYAALRQNWRIALILVLAEAFLKVPLSMMTGVGVDWVKLVIFGALQILVLYAGCRWVLYGAIRFDLPRLLKFAVRALTLQLLIILPAQLYFVLDVGSIALLPSHVAILSQGDAEVEKSIYWIKVLTEWPLKCGVILLLATWVPAALTSDRGGIVQALRRGWRTIWYVASRSLIGPVPFWILFSVLAVVSGDAVIDLLITLGGVGEGMYRWLSIGFVMGLVGSMAGIWIMLMIAIIVSRAYLQAEDQHRASC